VRPYKKPKYKLDVRKFDTDKVEKKEKKDFSIQELYREQLASKMRFRRR
jgi:hypothetical protein